MTTHRARSRVLALAGACVLGVGALAASSLAVTPTATNGTPVETTSIRTLVCPAPAAEATLLRAASGDYGSAKLGDDPTKASGFTRTDKVKDSWTLVPYGSVQPMGGYLSNIGDQFTWDQCGAATDSSVLGVADLQKTELVLANPDKTAVAVNLTFTDQNGIRNVSGARGIVVQPRSTRLVSLGVLAGRGYAGVTVQTDAGRVLATARALNTIDAAPSVGQHAARNLILPTLPKGASKVSVLLTNPGSADATVNISGMTTKGMLALAGGQSISVAGQHTVQVDIDKAVAGEAMTLQIDSDQPVSATASATVGKANLTVAAGDSGTLLEGVAASGGTLVLANPRSVSMEVEVTTFTNGVAGKPVTKTMPAEGTVELTATGNTLVQAKAIKPFSAGIVLQSDRGVVQALVPMQLGATTGTLYLSGDSTLR